jgi:hypothetical protein
MAAPGTERRIYRYREIRAILTDWGNALNESLPGLEKTGMARLMPRPRQRRGFAPLPWVEGRRGQALALYFKSLKAAKDFDPGAVPEELAQLLKRTPTVILGKNMVGRYKVVHASPGLP